MVFWKFSWYWEQKLTIFVNLLLKKTAHVQLGYHNWDTNWEYTLTPLSLYSESGVKVCCSHQLWSFFLFFTVLESCIRYHFSLIFRASCNIIWKIDFCPKFPFFNRFPQTPHHLNDQNLLSLTKVFCWCSLNVKALNAQSFLVYIFLLRCWAFLLE